MILIIRLKLLEGYDDICYWECLVLKVVNMLLLVLDKLIYSIFGGKV